MGEAASPMNSEFSKPFFLGIGGSGMSSLAHILLDAGFSVSGYDGKESQAVRELRDKGARIYSSLSEIPKDESYDAAVYSSAIRLDSHPIAGFFRDKGVRFFHRSDVLHSCFSELKCVSVAGSHGKTSTTAMTAFILEELGFSPSVMVGGGVAFLDGIGGRFGKGNIAVFESDESDGTFLSHRAPVRILTNIDEDHLDFYHTRERLLEAFARYISLTTERIVLDLDDPGICECLERVEDKSRILGFTETREAGTGSQKKETFGKVDITNVVRYRIESRRLFFEMGDREYFLTSRFPGRHYLTNSLAAVLTAATLGADPAAAAEAVSRYTGVRRRLEFLGSKNGVDVYDDYGHHPTEVKAVLSSIRELSQGTGRAVILFQPHRYTRTKNLFREFADSLDSGEIVLLLPIYSAGEDPIPGVDSGLIAEEMKKRPISLSGNLSSDLKIMQEIISKGDVLVSLGAGNVRDWALEYLKA